MNTKKNFLDIGTLIFLTAILLYWTEHQLIGLLIISLFAIVNAIKKGGIANSPQAFSIVAIVTFSSVIGSISMTNDFNLQNLTTALHAIVLIISISNINIKICTNTLNFFLKYFSILSLAATLTIFFESKTFFYFTHESGYQRYKFIFSEPSYLGLYSSFLLFLYIIRLDKWKTTNYIQCLSLTGIILATQSGSAIFMLLLSIIIASSWRTKFTSAITNYVKIFFYVGAIIGSIFLITPLFENFLIKRVTDTFSGTVDRSSELRFATPILLSQYTLDNFPLLGVGFGLHKEYITNNYSEFLHMTKINNQGEIIKNTNIDNGWVFLLFNSGLIGTLLITYIYIRSATKNKSNTKIYIYGSFLLLFTGSFINPLFLSLFFPKIYSQPSLNFIQTRKTTL